MLRDCLRTDAAGRAENEHLKRTLAAAHPHVDNYGDAKAGWMSDALARATR